MSTNDANICCFESKIDSDVILSIDDVNEPINDSASASSTNTNNESNHRNRNTNANNNNNNRKNTCASSSLVTCSNDSNNQLIDKCPVCLQAIRVKCKSYAPGCFHSFCYECLLEWTKVKHNCPLCKRDIDRIVYDIGASRLEFKEHYLKTSEQLQHEQLASNSESRPIQIIGYLPGSDRSLTSLFNLFRSDNSMLESESTNQRDIESNGPLDSYASTSYVLGREEASAEFRSLIYLNRWYVAKSQVQTRMSVTRETIDSDSECIESETPLQNQIFVQYKHVDRYHVTTPKWFKNNPGSTHRIMHFLHRELKAIALISSQSHRFDQKQRHTLLTDILGYMKHTDINSDDFLFKCIAPNIRPLHIAKHFVHELYAFCQSRSYDLIDYDAKCVYYDHTDLAKLTSSLSTSSPIAALPVNLNKYRLFEKKSPTISSWASSKYAQLNLADDVHGNESASLRATPTASTAITAATSRAMTTMPSTRTSTIQTNHPSVYTYVFNDTQSNQHHHSTLRTHSNHHFSTSSNTLLNEYQNSSINTNSSIGRLDDGDNNNNNRRTQQIIEDSAEDFDTTSEHSSFCEEVPLTPKRSPDYILVDSSDNDNDNELDNEINDNTNTNAEHDRANRPSESHMRLEATTTINACSSSSSSSSSSRRPRTKKYHRHRSSGDEPKRHRSSSSTSSLNNRKRRHLCHRVKSNDHATTSIDLS